jgi:zinc protease
MKKSAWSLGIYAAVLLCLTFPALRTWAAPPASVTAPQIKYEKFTLKNGLEVILAENHRLPLVAVDLWYHVGPANERAGRTGFAHLFEHMMFEGSANVGKGEHMLLVQNYGGSMNGSTNNDQTNYFEELPKNQLDMALFLESDRMRALNITQANLDNQRNAVQEERRLRVDNQPYGKSGEELEAMAYDSFPYHHSVIGSMDDLNAATLDDVKEFFRIYYAPNNVVLVLVGDLDPKETLAKVKKYFGDIPRQPAPPPVDAKEPEHDKERRKTLTDALARLPQFREVYNIVPGNTADFYALQVLGAILSGPGGGFGGGFGGGARSSRFYQHLVRDKQLALNAAGGAQQRRGPALFNVVAIPRPGVKIEDLEKAIDDEIEAIKKDGVTQAELEKVRTQLLRGAIQTRGSVLGLANQIGTATIWYNDPNLINTAYEKLSAVTAEQVKQVAQKYLVPAHRSVVITMPGGRGSAPAGAGAR